VWNRVSIIPSTYVTNTHGLRKRSTTPIILFCLNDLIGRTYIIPTVHSTLPMRTLSSPEGLSSIYIEAGTADIVWVTYQRSLSKATSLVSSLLHSPRHIHLNQITSL
jgi:hypothetical protein